MNLGEALVFLNPLLLLFSIYFGYNYIKGKDERHGKIFERLLHIILATHTIALLLLAYYFFKTDLRFEYVSDYSAETLSLGYKLAGVWAGRDGTLLIWAWATILSIIVERRLYSEDDEQIQITSVVGCVILLAFCIIQIFINPFSLNETVPIIGNGLNPVLLSPYMIIHPPIVFVSYGMIVLLYASGIAYLLTENPKWNDTIRRWGRGSWIGMSLALSLGGYWAYVTLGWGGYWAWDPVETAGLLPWLAMTSLLHTSVMSRRKNEYQTLGPLLAMLTFVLVLFESFVTRGGIWSSVHAFIVEETGGAWSRLGYVLENDVSVRGFSVLMIISMIVTFGLVFSKYSKKEPEKPKEYSTLEDYFSEDNVFFAAIYTQLLILTVTFVLLLVRVNGYMAPEVFEVRLAPFVVVLAAIFTIHTLRPFIDLQKILVVVGLGTVFSLVYAIMSEGDSWMVGAMIPWALICGYSIFRYMWRYRTKKLLPMLRAWGPYSAHLGMMLILIGYCFSYGLDTENTVTLQEGERKPVGEFVIELEEIEMITESGEIKWIVFVIITEDGEEIVNDQISKGLVSGGVYLKHEFDRDIYITLNSVDTNESTATITLREIPGIILVWTGTVMTILGMLMTMFTEWNPGKKWLRRIGK
tara:strand:- start:34 stop:1950 length:1917 start_codon:yes stop_codon:yes gene_type:complete